MQNSHKWISRFRLKSETWVYIPTLDTIAEGKRFKKTIEKRWHPPQNYYHLRDGGHIQAIKSHLSNKFFIHADLKKFFNSINRSRITRELKPYLGYNEARKIAMESTVSIQQGPGQVFALPFGFVQSTIIASLCLHKSTLGKTIHYLSKREDVSVSVYMDDIIISSPTLEVAEEALALVKQSADKSNLVLNQEKLQGPAETITAFNIHLCETQTIITDARFLRLKNDYQNTSNPYIKEGIMSYAYSVNPAQALGLDY